MPWQEESTMELRRQFIQDVQSGATPITEFCVAYGISRKTGYKWLGALGPEASRRAAHRLTTRRARAGALLEARGRHQPLGPRKLLRLVRQRERVALLARAQYDALHLHRAGLVVTPRRVRRPGHPGRPQAPMDTPNAVWTADFKGQFRLGDGTLCYPLTIADGYSRMP